MRLYAFALLLAAGCASNPLSNARYWPIEGCTSFNTTHVRFTRADGSLIKVLPKRTCDSVSSAAAKIQSVSSFYLSRIFIVDLEDPNAFATRDKDGSPIAIVSLGMMTAIGADEDAWAGLMGHEVAHLVKRHGDDRASAQASASGAGSVIANIVSAAVPGVGGFVGGTVAGTATQMAVYGAYTRPQEAEADELGLQWMVAAGYDPRGLVRLFEILGRRSSMPAFISTHPAAADRAQQVDAFIARNPTVPRAAITDSTHQAAPSTAQTASKQRAMGIAAANCADATSEIRLKTLCLSADGCRHEVDAIKKFCAKAGSESCSAAHEQLPTFCERASKAYSESACESAARRVSAYCRD